MKNNNLLIASIILLFSMLWLPMGQYEFLVDHWMEIGIYAIPFVGMGLFAFKERSEEISNHNYRLIAVVMLIAYIIHQFEEHWIDLYGYTYAFYTFNNNFILSNLGEPNSMVKPLTKESIFVINTSLVWLIGSSAILRSPKKLFPFFSMAGIIVINGFVHILAAIATQSYNPGLLTSVVVFIPIYFWIIKKTLNVHNTIRPLIFGGLIWAILAHIIMVAGLLASNWFNFFPEYIYWTLLIIWSILPVFMFRSKNIA